MCTLVFQDIVHRKGCSCSSLYHFSMSTKDIHILLHRMARRGKNRSVLDKGNVETT